MARQREFGGIELHEVPSSAQPTVGGGEAQYDVHLSQPEQNITKPSLLLMFIDDEMMCVDMFNNMCVSHA